MTETLSRPVSDNGVRRQASHPVEPLFLQRWSPRAFQPRIMPAADLHTMLEAARWAPSAHNLQPWHFVMSQRGDSHWQRHLELLHPFNAGWAGDASALLFLISRAVTVPSAGAPAQPSRTHSFDAGAAWAHVALQATALGYQAHAMAGIDFERAPEVLEIPDTHRLEIAIAIGRQSSAEQLPPSLRDREQPSDRRPLDHMISAGVYQPQRDHQVGTRS